MILDEAYCEFNVLDDPDATSTCWSATPTSSCCAPSPRSTACAACASATALCGSEAFRTAVDQVRQPFFANAVAQAAALEALRHQDEVARRVEQTIAARLELEDGLRELGLAADRLAGQLRLVRPPRGGRRARRSSARWASARCSSGRAPPLGRERCLRVTCGTPEENRRFLAALSDVL